MKIKNWFTIDDEKYFSYITEYELLEKLDSKLSGMLLLRNRDLERIKKLNRVISKVYALIREEEKKYNYDPTLFNIDEFGRAKEIEEKVKKRIREKLKKSTLSGL